MLFIQKAERFDKQFSEDYVKIMELKTPEKVKAYINGININWRKILMADTYFNYNKSVNLHSLFL